MNKKWKIVGIVACLGVMILLMNLSLDQRNALAHTRGDFYVVTGIPQIRDSIHIVFEDDKGNGIGEKDYDARIGWKFFTYTLTIQNNRKEEVQFGVGHLRDEKGMNYWTFYPSEWSDKRVIYEKTLGI